jgi:hypothetical protein
MVMPAGQPAFISGTGSLSRVRSAGRGLGLNNMCYRLRAKIMQQQQHSSNRTASSTAKQHIQSGYASIPSLTLWVEVQEDVGWPPTWLCYSNTPAVANQWQKTLACLYATADI